MKFVHKFQETVTKKLHFNFDATGIGSLPYKDAKEACRIIFDNFTTIPFWPQLPKRSYLENMYAQFSENLLPGLVLNTDSKTIYVDTSKVANDIERIYGKYVEGDIEFFAISTDYAGGFYEFLEHLKSPPKDMRFAKAQITGPVSYGLSLTDQNKRAVLYDKDLFEVLARTLTMKARWQIKKIKKYFGNVVIFIDEPYLVSIGSSFVNINMNEVLKKFDELIAALKKEGVLVGMHCCGNTDWSILLKRDIDILSFDAYNFMKEFLLYSDDIKNFLKKGGTIGWGVVPSSDAVDKETKNALSEKLKMALKHLNDKGVRQEDISSVITPSCGLGTLDSARAKKILELTKILSADLSKK